MRCLKDCDRVLKLRGHNQNKDRKATFIKLKDAKTTDLSEEFGIRGQDEGTRQKSKLGFPKLQHESGKIKNSVSLLKNFASTKYVQDVRK